MTRKQKHLLKIYRKFEHPILLLGAVCMVLVGATVRDIKERMVVRAIEYSPIKFYETIKTVEVPTPIKCESEKCKILAYLVEKFQDDAANAITMIRKCENSTFDPKRMSGLNIQKSGRRSYDVGVMQINVDELNVAEQERLKDYRYNIDQGFKKYKAAGNKFTAWSCSPIIGQANYLGEL